MSPFKNVTLNKQTLIFARVLIFSDNILKLYLKQFSHSMSVTKINDYARIQGKTSSLPTAKLAIFATDIKLF